PAACRRKGKQKKPQSLTKEQDRYSLSVFRLRVAPCCMRGSDDSTLPFRLHRNFGLRRSDVFQRLRRKSLKSALSGYGERAEEQTGTHCGAPEPARSVQDGTFDGRRLSGDQERAERSRLCGSLSPRESAGQSARPPLHRAASRHAGQSCCKRSK